jgi:hypothetical protein
VNSQFVQIALPIVITLIVAVFAQILTQNRAFDLLGKRIEDVGTRIDGLDRSLNKRIDNMADVLRAEMAKNHSELLAKLADVDNRLERRIEKLEEGRWKA